MKKLVFAFFTAILSFFTLSQELTEAMKIVASDRDISSNFGRAVAISGDYAVVGAYNQDIDVNGLNPLNSSGAAYIFERNASGDWVEVQKIVASDRAEDDFFGLDVSISGNYIIIGAAYEDHDIQGGNFMTRSGAAYIFERDNNGTWNEVQKIVASDRNPDDRFAHSVSISGDYAVVGARWDYEDENGLDTLFKAGSAYVFERDNAGTWNEVQKIVASDRAIGDFFGEDVSISGNQVVITSPFQDYDASGGNQVFGAGAGYVFQRDVNGNWIETQKLVTSDRAQGDLLGYACAMSGNRLVIGAAYESEDASGNNTLDDAGSAYVYEQNGAGVWNEVEKIVASDRGEDDQFGIAVAISGDTIVVGAYREDEDEFGLNTMDLSGAAYFFERDNSGTWNSVKKLVASDRATQDQYGLGIAVSGSDVLIGSFWEDEDEQGLNTLSSAGSAYFYEPCFTTYATDTHVACDSFTWINGITYTASNTTAVDTITNVEGCDSVVTLNLTVNYSTTGTDTQIACDAYTWMDGITYTGSNPTATWIIPNSVGCDSLITLDLTIINSTSGTDVQEACDSLVWMDGNTYYADNNSATWTIPNSVGCDSVITLDLTIGNTYFSDFHIGCESFTWIDGNTYTSSNTNATWIIPNAEGCDSIITLDLVIVNLDLTTTASVSNNVYTISSNHANATAYQWIDCNTGSEIPGETGQDFTVTSNGSYAVILTDVICSDTSDCIIIDDLDLENLALFSVQLAPNPTTDGFVTIQSESMIQSVHLKNLLGAEIRVPLQGNVLDVRSLRSGHYFVQIVTELGTVTRELIVTRP